MKTAFYKDTLVDATKVAGASSEDLAAMRRVGFFCGCNEPAVFVSPSSHGRSACFRSTHLEGCDFSSRDGEIDAPATGAHHAQPNRGEEITIKLGVPGAKQPKRPRMGPDPDGYAVPTELRARAATMRLNDIHRLLIGTSLSDSDRLVGGERDVAKVSARRFLGRFDRLVASETGRANAYYGAISSIGLDGESTFLRVLNPNLSHPPYVLIRGAELQDAVDDRFGTFETSSEAVFSFSVHSSRTDVELRSFG